MYDILFVDDEPKVLDGLRRMLRSLRHEWNMDFAEGGVAALKRLGEKAFDVVVTDMRMPGMDGAELLNEVRILHPATVRIILSGQCDKQTVLRTVGPAHQFLTKPCESETIKIAVARACRLRDRLTDDWHRQLVSRVQSVPTMPWNYANLMAELSSAAATASRAGQIIAGDPGMTAKIMKLVCNGFFGSPQRISDPLRAASLFDLDTLRGLATKANCFAPFDVQHVSEPLLREYEAHSRRVAESAKRLTIKETGDVKMAEDAYLAGLLHDIGVPILTQYAPEKYLDFLPKLDYGKSGLNYAELTKIPAAHADVGAYLAALWGLPDAVVDAIAYHHSPGALGSQKFSPLTAVHIADSLARDEFQHILDARLFVDEEYLKSVGVVRKEEKLTEECGYRCEEGATV